MGGDSEFIMADSVMTTLYIASGKTLLSQDALGINM